MENVLYFAKPKRLPRKLKKQLRKKQGDDKPLKYKCVWQSTAANAKEFSVEEISDEFEKILRSSKATISYMNPEDIDKLEGCK